MQDKLYTIISNAQEELRDRWENYRDEFYQDEPHDVIHEIADGAVPVYTNQLMELAAQNNSLATDEPELGPAFDGSPTPINIIAANLFEAIERGLWDEWQQMQEDADVSAGAELMDNELADAKNRPEVSRQVRNSD